jgi:tetratricopeptide (TPR) repeat protein
MLALDAPSEAADLFRQVLQHAPDADAYAGLGQAELAQTHYPAAKQAFDKARQLNSDDPDVEKSLALVERVLALDPSVRGLSSRERYSRSLTLLQGTLGALEQCAVVDGPPPSMLRTTIDEAHKLLSARRPPRSFGDATEENVSLAERLWAGHRQSCKSAPVDEALRRVLVRLAQ